MDREEELKQKNTTREESFRLLDQQLKEKSKISKMIEIESRKRGISISSYIPPRINKDKCCHCTIA